MIETPLEYTFNANALLAMKATVTFLLLCLAAPSWAQNGNGPYSINADTVRTSSRDGVSVTTYSGNARARVSDLLIEADTISIFGGDGLPSRVEATGNPVTFHQQASSRKLSGSAQKVVFLVSELKLTLIDYVITDPSGNNMKGRKATFVLNP